MQYDNNDMATIREDINEIQALSDTDLEARLIYLEEEKTGIQTLINFINFERKNRERNSTFMRAKTYMNNFARSSDPVACDRSIAQALEAFGLSAEKPRPSTAVKPRSNMPSDPVVVIFD